MKNKTKTESVRASQSEAVQPAHAIDTDTRPLLERLRAAASLEEALAILQPTTKARPKADVVYEVVEGHANPLPQKRGVAVKAYTVAVRLNKPFKVADVEAELPDTKAVGFWVRKLAALGFLKPQAS